MSAKQAKGSGDMDDDHHDENKRLRREILSVLNSNKFCTDTKSSLLEEIFMRYQNENNLRKERAVENLHRKKHPNVLKGGGHADLEQRQNNNNAKTEQMSIENNISDSSATNTDIDSDDNKYDDKRKQKIKRQQHQLQQPHQLHQQQPQQQ